jgi:hypothetical protein
VIQNRSSKDNGTTGRLITMLCLLAYFPAKAQQVIDTAVVHLRNGNKKEWSLSPEKADSQLVVHFNAQTSKTAVIAITHTDVTQAWNVLLNDTLIGKLAHDENKLVTYLTCTPGAFKPGQNSIVVRAENAKVETPDDIIISDITIYNKSYDSLLHSAYVNIMVKDDSGRSLPSRLTIVNQNKALQPVAVIPGDTLAVRAGVIYSGTGNYSFSLPEGKYMIYASRGFEYGVDSVPVTATSEQQDFSSHFRYELNLKREIILPRYSSVDTHVHTLEYSGHGDATMKERVLTIAGEGLNYAVVTEHNKAIDIREAVKKMKMGKWFIPIRGDELTTKVGHFNIFPLSSDSVPDAKVDDWKQIASIRKSGRGRVVILNHARDIHAEFRPSDTMFNISPADFPANAMEIMNSGSQQTNPRQLYLDWMMLMKRGVILTPVGSSDSHDMSRFIVGQARTYVRNDSSIVTNILNHRAGVSFGLFTEVSLDTSRTGSANRKHKRSKSLPVTIKVYSPSWIHAQTVTLFVNGEKVFSSGIKPERRWGLVNTIKTLIPRPARGAFVVAVAEGRDPKIPWWPIAKPYQHTSGEVNPIVLGISEPFFIR